LNQLTFQTHNFNATGIIGFSGANVFYDSLLSHVAKEKEIDYISGLGYSMGYLGGGLLFLVNILMVLMPGRFGFSDSAQAIRYAFLSVACWWGFFTLFTILWVPEPKGPAPAAARGRVVRKGIFLAIGMYMLITLGGVMITERWHFYALAISIGRIASRCSIGSIMILFVIGGVLFYFVDEQKGKSEAALLAEK
jgi:MFS-type transporter involved in bile tolerance (Atg22 family)